MNRHRKSFQFSSPLVGIALAAAIGLIGVVVGCNRDSGDISEDDLRSGRALAGSQDHLARAISTLERIDQYDQNQARAKVISQLSQWIESQPPVEDWLEDPLINTIGDRYKAVFRYAPLNSMTFVGTDYHSIAEAIWLRQIAQWQLNKLRDEKPQPFLAFEDAGIALRKLNKQFDDLQRDKKDATDPAQQEQLENELGGVAEQRKQAEAKLASAQAELELFKTNWLFDWTIRNIQLDETHWDQPLVISKVEGETPVPPPGAEYHAWQALLLGHADAVTRARVFILLCRQADIDVVMLGLESTTPKHPPRDWLAAALIGDDVYLYEPELGLPVLGPGGAKNCTLAELREQPELLRQFDTQEYPYFAQPQDLQRIVPLIDAGLEALSQRMLLIEQSLREGQQVVLTVTPSVLAKKLRRRNLPDARIWEAPYRVYMFEAVRQQNPQQASKFFQEMAVFTPPIELWPARLHHFRGQIDQPQQASASAEPGESRGVGNAATYRHGARHFYLACRNPEGEIEAIQNELAQWFAQDPTRSQGELLAQLRYDLYVVSELEQRRSQLKAGNIDPAEQFYRQQLEAEAVERDPESVIDLRRGEQELTPEELEILRVIESRLQVLSPATREWIERLPPEILEMGEENRGSFLDHFKRVATDAKHHATWWLAITSLETGNAGVAVNYLQQRVLEGDADSPWVEHAHHHLGRSYERSLQREQAIEHYQADQSPQRHGSLVRAARLAEDSGSN